MKLNIIDWEEKNYDDALIAQRELLELRISDKIPNTLVLTEHPAVFTIGRQGKVENILVGNDKLKEENIEILNVERGGDITYHGVGQLVAYPIFKMPEGYRNIKKFFRMIEKSVVETCWEFGVNAVTIENLTGVWVGPSDCEVVGPSDCEIIDSEENSHLEKWTNEKKICSIGLAFKKWTSYHGVALNVNCNLKPFSYMHLCGLKGKEATSLEQVLNKKSEMKKVKKSFINNFENNWKSFIGENYE